MTPEELKWSGVSATYVDYLYPQVSKYIAEALAVHGYDNADPEYYVAEVRKNRMQLWVLYAQDITGICLTQLHTMHTELICSVPIVAGGSTEEWEVFTSSILEPWCLEQGVTRIEIRGRPAVGRILNKHGYSVSDIITTKRIERVEH